MKVGDTVRVTKVPDGIPEGDRPLFSECVGKVFRINAIEADGRVELLVGQVAGEPNYMHSIYLWPDEIEPENSN
jgi:hypothetical protein